MLILRQVSKTYKPKKGREVEALKDINLTIAEKGLVFLLGKSGSGKSTIMNVIGGLDIPDTGEIYVNNKNIVILSNKEYDAYRNTTVGFIFQEFNLIESFSVYKNIVLSLELQGKVIHREEISNLLETLDLKNEIDRMPYELSGGQKQRVSIARTLVKNPKIILADEPTGSLDSETGKQIFELLKKLSKDQLVIVVSHDREYAQKYGDRVIELADGRVIKDSKPLDNYASNQDILELVPSSMPLKDAFVLGFNAFIRKPVRMMITLLLLVFAFTLFGVVDSTANYNINEVVIEDLYNRNEMSLVISRVSYDEINENYQFTPHQRSHLLDLQEKHVDYYMKEVYIWKKEINTVFNPGYNYDYYARFFSGVVEIDQEFLDYMEYNLIGRLPENFNEVVIPLHVYENYQTFGYDDQGKVFINNPEDLLGKKINSTENYVVVGIIDTNFNKERYQRVFDQNIDSRLSRTLSIELSKIKDSSIHTYLYMYPGFIDDQLSLMNPNELIYGYIDIETYTGQKGNPFDMNEAGYQIFENRTIAKVSTLPDDVIYIEGFNQTDLEQHQVILPMDFIRTNYAIELENNFDYQVSLRREELIDLYAIEHFESIKDEFQVVHDDATWEDFAQYIKENQTIPFIYDYEFNTFHVKAVAEKAMSLYWNLDDYFALRVQHNSSNLFWNSSQFDIEIVGYYEGVDVLVNNDFFDEIQYKSSRFPFMQVIVKLSGDRQHDLMFLHSINENEERFEASNEIEHLMLYYNDPIIFFANILVWVALGLAIFSGLLFYNFMSVSIQHKKKDVGILRALGARRTDVFMIFLFEALIISMIVFGLSFISSYLLVTLGDRYIGGYFGIEVSILWVSFRQFITLLLMNIGVAILSSWIPIYRFTKEKPIDTIKVL